MITAALQYVLSTDTANAAIVSKRVYPLSAPHGAKLPYETYQMISAPHEQHLGGPSPLTRARVQVDCFALTYAVSQSMSDAVRKALDGLRGLIGPVGSQVDVRSIKIVDRSDDHTPPVDDDHVGVYRARLDAEIFFNEPTT